MLIESAFIFVAVIWGAGCVGLAVYLLFHNRADPLSDRLIAFAVLLLIAAAGAGICYALGAFFFEIFG